MSVTQPSAAKHVENSHIFMMQFKVQQLGWQGLIGIMLLIFGMAIFALETMPAMQKIAQLSAEVVTLKSTPRSKNSARGMETQFDLVQKFYAFIPKQNAVNHVVADILRQAKAAGLEINQVTYTPHSDASTLASVQITLPVQGRYVEVRQLINQVLNAWPAVALKDVDLQRQDIMSDRVDANLQWTLYLKRD